MDELKPCPFCGSSDIAESRWVSGWTICCYDCDAEGPHALTIKEAVEKWNDRKGTNINDEGN